MMGQRRSGGSERVSHARNELKGYWLLPLVAHRTAWTRHSKKLLFEKIVATRPARTADVTRFSLFVKQRM